MFTPVPSLVLLASVRREKRGGMLWAGFLSAGLACAALPSKRQSVFISTRCYCLAIHPACLPLTPRSALDLAVRPCVPVWQPHTPCPGRHTRASEIGQETAICGFVQVSQGCGLTAHSQGYGGWGRVAAPTPGRGVKHLH